MHFLVSRLRNRNCQSFETKVCPDRNIKYCGVINEDSEDSDLNYESLEIVDERNGAIFDGIQENKNIFWISPKRSVRNQKPQHQQQNFQEQLFDMIFLNRYNPKARKNVNKSKTEDPERIERIKSVDSSTNARTFAMILKEAGFQSPTDLYSLTDYSTLDSIGWIPNMDKRFMKIISKQYVFLSPILFLITYLPSAVFVLMFYLCSSETFG